MVGGHGRLGSHGEPRRSYRVHCGIRSVCAGARRRTRSGGRNNIFVCVRSRQGLMVSRSSATLSSVCMAVPVGSSVAGVEPPWTNEAWRVRAITRSCRSTKHVLFRPPCRSFLMPQMTPITRDVDQVFCDGPRRSWRRCRWCGKAQLAKSLSLIARNAPSRLDCAGERMRWIRKLGSAGDNPNFHSVLTAFRTLASNLRRNALDGAAGSKNPVRTAQLGTVTLSIAKRFTSFSANSSHE